MKYVLLIGLDECDVPEEIARHGCGGWGAEMARRGVVRGGAGLGPAAQAVTVRVRDGDTLVSDGPFAETKDQIGGFVLIECADLEEAVEIAAAHPVARYGSIEIRPVLEP
ncbi:transcription initiation protein [Nonomuraea sp. NN258]|uniref:YciI family protein n=1 Tax=Nonomuraea antri TaxID=2730852 RepID=UPI0015686749|nr:YciI family protein [Nonomuraea antri]NRQ40736.1 transcription initiation protein [Nonomuraea antri]